jgi:hypothetical protein
MGQQNSAAQAQQRERTAADYVVLITLHPARVPIGMQARRARPMRSKS